ncbi:MAG: hypothetical protein VB031_03610 [Eubacteriaceae bacterium]|nr:hypothetical protein [Eubacteriaceae bacterium]
MKLEKEELMELEKLEREIKEKTKAGTIELDAEELEMISGGDMSPYKKKKLLEEIKKRILK